MQSNIAKIKTVEKSSNPEEIELVFNKNKARGFKYLKISKEHVKMLDDCFTKSIYPSKETYCELAESTKLPVTKIENWFKFQRKKHLGVSDNTKYQKRRILKPEEERILEDHFRESQNPNYETLKELASLLRCKKKQVRNWFAYRRKKLNKLRRKRGGPRANHNNHKSFFSGSNKDTKKEHKADSSSLESNKIFLEDKNSTSSTSNQNTKKELSNNESSENKVHSYDSQMKTELTAPYTMKNNAMNMNVTNSQDDNNLTQSNENTEQKLNRMAQGNQQIFFTNKPYFNQQYNPIYYNGNYNQANTTPIFLNGYSKYAFIPSNVPQVPQVPQYRTYNMLVPINQLNQQMGVNMGYYPMMTMLPGGQNQMKMAPMGNQWIANVSGERNNGGMCMNEIQQNEMKQNDMNR